MELPEIIDQETEPPQYQQFITLNIQVPHVEGQHIYDRVTVTSSLQDLAGDLSLVLPSAVKRSLQIKFQTPHGSKAFTA